MFKKKNIFISTGGFKNPAYKTIDLFLKVELKILNCLVGSMIKKTLKK